MRSDTGVCRALGIDSRCAFFLFSSVYNETGREERGEWEEVRKIDLSDLIEV